MHQPVRTTFKLFPTNGLFGSQTSSLGQQFSYPVSPLLTYLYDSLEKYSFALVRNKAFSLVNIAASKQNLSVGYSDVTYGKFADGDIQFTFALITVPKKKATIESKYIPLRSHDFLWGRSGKGAEYLTITLDQQQRQRLFPEIITTKMLTNLYNIVGMCSKSYVLNPRGWYSSDVYDTKALESMRTRYLTQSPNTLFKNVPIGYWVYNKYVWQDYSQFIVPQLIDENFYRYFTVNILPVLPPELNGDSLDWVYRDHDSGYSAYIKRGLLSLLMAWKTNDFLTKVTDEQFSVLNIFYQLMEESSFLTAEADEEALRLYHNILTVAQSEDPFIRTRFQNMFVDINGVVYNMITSDPQLAFRFGEFFK